MALLDLLGRRWALRVLWELRDGPLTFRELQARCGSPSRAMSPSVLNGRLTELRDAGIVETAGQGYRLTPEGRKLIAGLEPLHRWAERWAKRDH
jgi:DNA-binding HxlR family transcriptional regulator